MFEVFNSMDLDTQVDFIIKNANGQRIKLAEDLGIPTVDNSIVANGKEVNAPHKSIGERIGSTVRDTAQGVISSIPGINGENVDAYMNPDYSRPGNNVAPLLPTAKKYDEYITGVVANSSDKPPAAFPTHLIDKKTVAAFPTHLIDRKTVVGIAGRYGIPASRMGQIAEATGKGDAAVLNNLTPEEKQAHMEFLNYAGSIPEIREQLMLANPEVQAGQSALNVSNNTILGVANEKVLNTSQGVADKINQSVLARPAVIADIHSEASKKLGISASDPNWKPISDKFGSLDKLIQGYQDGTITDEILAKSGLNEQQLAMINQLKVSSDMAIDQRSEHFFSKASLSGDGKAALDKLCKETNLTPAELRSNMRSRGTFLKQTKDIHASIGRGDPAKGEQLLKDIAGKEAAYNALKNIDWKRWVEVIGGVLAAVGGMFAGSGTMSLVGVVLALMGLFDNPTSMGELTMGNLGNKAKQMGGAIGGITTALSPIKDIPDTKQ